MPLTENGGLKLYGAKLESDGYIENDLINEDMGGMASHMMEIIKLQSRVAILEKTVEFSRNDGM